MLEKLDLKNKVVIHCGGHQGEEMESYMEYNPKMIIWVEAIPHFANKIKEKIQRKNAYTNQIVINKAIFNKDNEKIKFKICNQPWASSIFDLGADRNKYWAHHEIIEEIECETITLDVILQENNINPSDVELLTIDVQGAEILAFQGASKLLSELKNIWTEATWVETYKDAPKKQDIDDFLLPLGFKETYREDHDGKHEIESNLLYQR